MKEDRWLPFATALLCLFALTFGCTREDRARPGPLADRVDALFSEYDKPDSPGCALGVVQDGQLIYKRGYGMASLEHSVPISPKSVFRIGSVSKQFTAAAIALLAEQGKLSLDDDIRVYLPEIPTYGQRITIRHLIHHTSGLRDYTDLAFLAGIDTRDLYTPEESLQLIARQRATAFEPGAQYSYSNSGYFLLSQIVERATGRSLRELAHEQIFVPLGMEHTHFHDRSNEVVSERAFGYLPDDDGGYRVDITSWEQIGDGSVFTTIEDLLLWDRNFYANRLGKGGPQLIETLTTPGRLSDGEAIDYAFGLSVGAYRGLETVSHGGFWAGFRAHRIRFPEQRFSVAILCNVGTARPDMLAMRVADLYLDQEFKEEPIGADHRKNQIAKTEGIGPTAGDLRRLEGNYWNEKHKSVRGIRVEEGHLLFTHGEGDESKLIGIGEYRFVPEDDLEVTVSFSAPTEGAVRTMVVQRNGGERTAYEAFEPVAPTGATLSRYAGAYECEEINARYVLDDQDDRLVFSVGHLRDRPLRPLFPGIFEYQGWATFTFDDPGAAGPARSFSIATDRAQDFECIRMP